MTAGVPETTPLSGAGTEILAAITDAAFLAKGVVAGLQTGDATLTALAGLTWSAGSQALVFTGVDTVGLATVGQSAGNILNKAAGDALYQPLDGTLTAMAGVTTAADKLIYATGADAFATTDLTAFARTLLDDANAGAARTTLGLGSSAVKDTGTSGNTVPLLDGANTWSGAQTFSALVTLENYAFDADQITPSAGAATVNCASGNANFFYATAAGAVTWTFSNPPASGTVYEFTLELTNGGAGAQTWPASVKWHTPGGTAPTLKTTGVDVLTFYSRDGGTTWRGFHGGGRSD